MLQTLLLLSIFLVDPSSFLSYHHHHHRSSSIFLIESTLLLQNPLTGYISSCYGAGNITSAVTYCSFAHWGVGTLFSTTQGFTTYEPGKAVGVAKQDQLAQLYSAYLLSDTPNPNSNCRAAISWFSCTTVFPYCPIQSNHFSATSYFTTCRIHCEQVNLLCNVNIDCTPYKSTNCALYIPDSYVFLPPSRGPYNRLPLVYGILASIWFASTILWLYICFTSEIQPNTALLKLITSIYFTRIGLCVTLCLFWIDCNTIEYYCTTSSTSNSSSALRLLETYQFFAMFLLARGWMVTRVTLTTFEWSLIYISTIVYLICCFTFNNIISTAPSKNWIIYTTIIYFILYSQIIFANWKEIQYLRSQLIRLNLRGIMEEIYHAITLKFSMYLILFSMFFMLILLEIICEILFISNSSIMILELLFEIISWWIIVGISYNFRPRKYSPFFFMIPVPSQRMTIHQINPELSPLDNSLHITPLGGRLPSIVMVEPQRRSDELEDDHHAETELELYPLIRNRMDGFTDSSLIVMNKEDGSIELGVHSRALDDQENIVS